MGSLNRISGSERGIWPPRRTLHRCPKEAPMSDQATAAPSPEQPPVEYRDIPGYPGYRVGSDGSVWSCFELYRLKGARGFGSRMTDSWHQRKPRKNSRGYLFVCLRKNPGEKLCAVHRLVLEAFVGPCPEGMVCCHYPDNNRTNNALKNLRWDTPSENSKDILRDTPIPSSKACLACRQVKPLSGFYACFSARDGRQTLCAVCGDQRRLARSKAKTRRNQIARSTGADRG